MKVTGVLRADRFSPNSVDKDRMILSAVLDEMKRRGCDVSMVSEEDADADINAGLIFSMARTDEALDRLSGLERKGVRVINKAEGVRACRRSHLDQLMRREGFSMPPQKGNDGFWLKRGDGAAQSRGDVVFCEDETALQKAIADMERRGITDHVVSAHVVGDLIKFYGVGDSFFRYYYPTDDHQWKFADEARNGEAHHYAFSAPALQKEVTKLSLLTETEVYGGDAIIDENGKFFIIDFNDWPSFSRCREEAAKAIAELTDF